MDLHNTTCQMRLSLWTMKTTTDSIISVNGKINVATFHAITSNTYARITIIEVYDLSCHIDGS